MGSADLDLFYSQRSEHGGRDGRSYCVADLLCRAGRDLDRRGVIHHIVTSAAGEAEKGNKGEG